MGTIIDRVEIARAGWRGRHSALHLAVVAAKSCLHAAQRETDDVDLLVNAGIYRDKNLGEPALAALIQEDIGANPEDPHGSAHGTFSFDIANGTCGILTGLQIADGILRSHTINCALVIASDADPGRGRSEHFPFRPWVRHCCAAGPTVTPDSAVSAGSTSSTAARTSVPQWDPTTRAKCCGFGSRRCSTSGWPLRRHTRRATGWKRWWKSTG